jgi:hypothetical protein
MDFWRIPFFSLYYYCLTRKSIACFLAEEYPMSYLTSFLGVIFLDTEGSFRHYSSLPGFIGCILLEEFVELK